MNMCALHIGFIHVTVKYVKICRSNLRDLINWFFFYPRQWAIGRNMTLRKGNACFNIIYLNARSILPKIDGLRVLCVSNSYDVICIVESWLSSDIDNSY